MQRNLIEQGRPIPAADALEGLLQVPVTRRQALGGIASAIALSLAACRGQTTPQSPRSQREMDTPLPLSDNQLIDREIQRLGITVSQKERDLFENNWFSRSLLTNETEVFQEAARRVDVTLAIMRVSENPYLQNSAALLFSWIDEGKAGIEVSHGNAKSNATADLKVKEGKLFGQISIDFQDAAYSLTPLTLALAIVHEVEHLKNFFATQDRLPATHTLEERLEIYKRERANQQLFLEEEARGYAAQARAFIYQHGLLRYKNTPDFSPQIWAAALLRAQNDTNSPAWVNYVATILPK